MDKTTLKAQHPDVYDAIHAEGVASVDTEAIKKAAKEEGMKEGGIAECQRVKDVRAQLVPGHEALIEQLATDGKTTGPEAAQAVVLATQKQLEAQGDAVSQDAAALIAPSDSPEEDVTAGLTDEQKLEATWKGLDADTKATWGSFAAFAAYKKNEGRAKVLGGPVVK